jgi:hypothetical protein
LVMFNGMCHHVGAATMKSLLVKEKNLLTPGGRIVVSDPIIGEKPTWLELKMIELDRRANHRTAIDLVPMLSMIPGLTIAASDHDDIRISLVR